MSQASRRGGGAAPAERDGPVAAPVKVPAPRAARVERATRETVISVSLKLDGGPIEIDVDSESAFFAHMLHSLALYAGWGLKLKLRGDVEVDLHHSCEDAGLALGEALAVSLGDFTDHGRFGSALVPMDDALAEAALDAGRRPHLSFEVDWPQPIVGTFDACLVEEFFKALTWKAGWTLHLTGRRGKNSHHLCEALFKAAGLAAAAALAPRSGATFSTKGSL
jgi:imidazoleglycerol-phosphate dehydratase